MNSVFRTFLSKSGVLLIRKALIYQGFFFLQLRSTHSQTLEMRNDYFYARPLFKRGFLTTSRDKCPQRLAASCISTSYEDVPHCKTEHISSVGFYTEESVKNTDLLPSLFSMAAIDVLVGSICVLVFVLNELWSDKAKTKIVYRKMPSDTVFSDIASGKIDATGFDLVKAQRMYTHMSKATANQQTAEWNRLLKKSRDSGWGNVIEAERLQLMTRDICMSTVSLLIMTGIVLVVLVIVSMSVWNPIKMLAIPLMYLVTIVMF